MTTLYFCLMFACFTWVAAYPGNIVGKFRMYKLRDRWGNDITTTEDLTPDECAHYCLNMTQSHGEYCMAIMFHPYLDGSRRGTCYYKRLLGPMQFLDDGKGCEFYERIPNTDDCLSCDSDPCLNGGWCIEHDQQGCCTECHCPWDYAGDNCETKLVLCEDYGDPHYYPFDDGSYYSYQGACKYVLTANVNADEVPYFNVTTKNEHLYDWTNATYPKYVEIDVYGKIIRLKATLEATMEGEPEPLPLPYVDELGRFTIVREEDPSYTETELVQLRTDFDLVLNFNPKEWYRMVKVLLPPTVAGKVDGLCRYYDGDPSNDYILPDGTDCTNPIYWNLLGNYFEVHDDEDPFCLSPPPPPDCDDTTASQIESSTDYCGYINDTTGPFADCIASVPWQMAGNYMRSCVYDVCQAWEHGEFARRMAKCAGLAAFASYCSYEGVPASADWTATAGCDGGYIILPGACINESNYVIELGTSLDECSAMCDADDTCLAFEHKESRQRCQLSHEGLGTEHMRDPCHVSGYDLYFKLPQLPTAGGA